MITQLAAPRTAFSLSCSSACSAAIAVALFTSPSACTAATRIGVGRLRASSFLSLRAISRSLSTAAGVPS